jgi:hypothetical protein
LWSAVLAANGLKVQMPELQEMIMLIEKKPATEI